MKYVAEYNVPHREIKVHDIRILRVADSPNSRMVVLGTKDHDYEIFTAYRYLVEDWPDYMDVDGIVNMWKTGQKVDKELVLTWLGDLLPILKLYYDD